MQPISSFWSLTKQSAFLGAKTGLALSSLFVVFFTLSVFVIGIHTRSFREDPLLTFIFGTILFAVLGCIFGIIPGVLVGTMTALIISSVLWLVRRWLSALLSIVLGVAICAGLATLVESAVWSRITDKATTIGIAYYLWRGLPTIIYILTGGFVGWKLFERLAGKNSNTELPSDPRRNDVDVAS